MVWKGRNLEGQKYHLEEALQCSNGRPLSRNVVSFSSSGWELNKGVFKFSLSPPLACPLLLVKAITAAFGEAKPSDPTTVDELCALRTMAARLSRVRVLIFLSLVSLPTHRSLGGVFLTTPRHS